ncbi:MAG TPA: hypothetical protein DEH22_16475 [Chloroflexi bacterium]|nr:hypothetical protein [Chloroflexota bacterium]
MRTPSDRSIKTTFQTLLRNRLLLPVLMASLLIIGFAAFNGGRLMENQQLRYNRSVGYAVSNFLLHAGHELETINYVSSGNDIEKIRTMMEANWKAHRLFDTLYYLDESGIIQVLVPADPRYEGLDMSRQSYFINQDCAAGVNISPPFTSLRTGQPTVYLSLCAQNGGLIVGELNLSALQETISVGKNIFDSMNVFVVDESGNLLAYPDPEWVLQHVNVSDWQVVERGQEFDSIVWYRRDNGLWVGSTSNIEPTGWVVISEVPFGAIYAPYLGAMLAIIFVFGILFILLLRGFFHQFQIQLIRPLTQLSEGTDALAAGDYSVNQQLAKIPVSFAEIKHLLINFQNMSTAILFRETMLRESEAQYRRLVEFLPEAIIVHSDNKVIYANAAAIKLYAAKNQDELLDVTIYDLTHPVFHDLVVERMNQLRGKNQIPSLPLAEQKHIRLDQTVFDAEVTTSSIIFDGKAAAQSIIRDITQRKDEEQRLKYLATHDFLTDLPNRFLFQDRINQTLLRSKRDQHRLAVLYLDLDNFKAINDAFGHSSGDFVLQLIAESLRGTLRETDTIARIGGDEFVILIESITDLPNAALVANKILQSFKRPITIQEKEVQLTLSIGISIYPDDGLDAQQLLQAADAAMYRAKDEGKNRFKFYASEMRSRILEQIDLTAQLRRALEREEFFLVYQPQVNSQTGELIGVEALIRWQHPHQGVIPPGQFISLAEENGLTLPLGEWVLRTACQQGRQWQEISPLRVAVNITDRQLKQSNLPHTIQGSLGYTGFDPHLLELELTENIVFAHASVSFNHMQTLKDMGITLAVDDFGTGYATLRYLSQFPFDRLKIDQRLAPNILTQPKDVAIVSGIIDIGQSLGMQVIAEGVETPEQLAFYEAHHCYNIQGWYYSKAVAAEQITQILKNGTTWQK